MVEKDEMVADFELPDETGTARRLSEFLSRGPVVLFFYPAAGSRGCSIESRHFRDLAEGFTAAGTQVVGISVDGVSKQKAFADECLLGFPLLSDGDGSVAKELGVKRRFGPIPVKRWTFVIGTDRKVVDVIKSEINMALHADRALEIARQLPHG